MPRTTLDIPTSSRDKPKVPWIQLDHTQTGLFTLKQMYICD